MAKFQFIRDEERSQSLAQFQGKLLSMSQEPVGQFPSGKMYHVGTIEFENDKGKTVQTSCIINKANFDKGMSEGTTYLCSVIVKDGQSSPLVICSHLVGSSARADFSDFGINVSASAKVVNANPLVVA
jgi:hypothetical protein